MNRILKIWIAVIFLLASTNCWTQEKKYRSYSKVHIPVNVELLIDSALQVVDTDEEHAFELIKSALQESIKTKNTYHESRCYAALGTINTRLEQTDLAIDYYKKALQTNPNGATGYSLEITFQLAKTLQAQNSYLESNEYYQQALEIAEKLGVFDRLVEIRYGLASNYISLGNSQQALDQYEIILQIESSRNNEEGLVEINTRMGDFMLQEDNVDEAEMLMQNSLEQARKSKNRKLESRSLQRLSKVYEKKKDIDNQLITQQQSLEISEEEEMPKEIAEKNLELGNIYFQKQEMDKAVEHIERGIEVSDQTKDVELKSKAYKQLSEVYSGKKEYDKALLAYTNYAKLIDSVHTKKQKKLEADLQLVASVSRKVQRIEMLEQDYQLNKKAIELYHKEQEFQSRELKVQKMINYALFFVLIAIMVSGLFVLRSALLKRKANMLLALKSLRSQMNPHFIFNSLNSVNNYISQNDERMANKYLTEFSRLMRSVLENSKHDFVPMQSEIDTIKLYLKLEHQRFEDKFDYELNIEEGLENSSYVLPPMLIQPYIENAIWHGLRYKESKGLLKVEVKLVKNAILVSIMDNGIGRKKSAELKTKHQKIGTSTGLRNTMGRIDILNGVYKTSYSVNIDDLNKEDCSGTVVTINIPLKNDKTAQ
ncbi:MAG: tetratricopeptide repeat protein [Bacteroidales bacterium]|nr:tetratricopeptide repeat protein [Bacteroidales bacterium]